MRITYLGNLRVALGMRKLLIYFLPTALIIYWNHVNENPNKPNMVEILKQYFPNKSKDKFNDL